MKPFLLLAGLLLFAGAPAFSQETMVVPPGNMKPANAPLEYAMHNNEVVPGSAVVFSPGTADILPSSDHALRTIRKYLDDKTAITQLRIEGHTVCGKGDQALSEARAKAVADWLIAHGVDCKRLVAAGFGCSKPLFTDHAELNERIEFIIAALRGHLIGGMPADGGGRSVSISCL